MSTGPDDADREHDADDELPIYCAQPLPGDIPGFIDRALGHLRAETPEGDFTFEQVDFEIAGGVWLAPIGVYDPDADTPSTPDQVAAGASPTGPYGWVMRDYEAGVRQALRGAWGEGAVHTPRLVGSAQEPEGILDYLLVAQDIAEALLWDRGEMFVALLTDWSGEPGSSNLRQILMVLPREFIMSGLGVFLTDADTAHPAFMHGEHPLELRRRAWILSATYGAGEARLRGAPIDATRCSLQSVGGTTTVWTFADDGRVLLLLLDPESEFARSAAQQFSDDNSPDGERLADAQLILIDRLLDGVPEDLRACIWAEGEAAGGGVAVHDLEFGLLNGQPVPVISGAFWFDGQTWHATRGLMETGKRNGFGMDDFGVATALRRPYRLGGAFTVDMFPADTPERRQWLERIFAACPFPEQPRPEGSIRLGYAIPSSAGLGEMVDQIERATAAWWDRSPADARLGDDTFSVGGRRLGKAGDPSVLTASIGRAEPWTLDALKAWSETLIAVMGERWGDAHDMRGHDPQTGAERRTPLARVMRGTGLMHGPLWWVNGHAVLLLAGMPDPSYSNDPEVIVVLAKADTVRELVARLSIWELRLRARVISNLAALAALPENSDAAPQAEEPIRWDGPALTSSDVVPPATRGGLRAGRFFWVWHLTHDGRGLLTSHAIGGSPGSFEEQQALFAGVPDDLLSLVADRAAGAPYPVVTRAGDPQGADLLGRARSLPDAAAVFFHDGFDWRAPAGMLLAARAAGVAGGTDTVGSAPVGSASLGWDPLDWLHSTEVGVPQLQWALRVGGSMSPETLADPEYSRSAFSRPVTREEAARAFAMLGTPLAAALLGTVNDLLDVIVDQQGYRNVLDAALSNPDPQRRHELVLWLLGQRVNASSQLSFLTPLNVLLDNPTLGAADAALVRRLLRSGAQSGAGLLGARPGGHPLVQLCQRDIEESQLLPLAEALLDLGAYDLEAPELPDGRSLLEYVRAGAFDHQRSRAHLLELVEAVAAMDRERGRAPYGPGR